MNFSHLALSIHTLGHALAPQFNFPQGSAVELIMLRWLQFIFGIIWIGLPYFFNLVGVDHRAGGPALLLHDPFRRRAKFRQSGADAALVRVVVARLAGGLRADL